MQRDYCLLEDAFIEPQKQTVHDKVKQYIPMALSGTHAQTQTQTQAQQPNQTVTSIPEPMTSYSGNSLRPDAMKNDTEYFPLPGETAGNDDWTRAFTLGPSATPYTINVAGGPTLWRQQPVQSIVQPPMHEARTSLPGDIQRRLDILTKQLESLTHTTPMQNTAELFLFIAIGLLFLLALDTLLRCATMVAISVSKKIGKQRGGMRRWKLQ